MNQKDIQLGREGGPALCAIRQSSNQIQPIQQFSDQIPSRQQSPKPKQVSFQVGQNKVANSCYSFSGSSFMQANHFQNMMAEKEQPDNVGASMSAVNILNQYSPNQYQCLKEQARVLLEQQLNVNKITQIVQILEDVTQRNANAAVVHENVITNNNVFQILRGSMTQVHQTIKSFINANLAGGMAGETEQNK